MLTWWVHRPSGLHLSHHNPLLQEENQKNTLSQIRNRPLIVQRMVLMTVMVTEIGRRTLALNTLILRSL